MRCSFSLPLTLAMLAATTPAPCQIIYGTLLQTDSRTPLPGGVMTLLDEDSAALRQLRTDSAGAFSITIPRRGTYRLRAEGPGFRPATSPELTIGPLDTLQVEFTLGRDAVVLEPLVVKARNRRLTPAARRFYDRAAGSISGTFVGRDAIEEARPRRTTELLRRVPGVQLSPAVGGNNVMIRGTCRPTVYVDGVRVTGYRTIDDLAQPADLEGLEVYRDASQAPAEYTGLQAGCAAVLLWTRIE